MNNSKHHWKEIFSDTLVFGVLFGLTNIVSYLFIVIAGRSLATAEFGVFNSLLGLLTMIGVMANSLQVAVTQAITSQASRSMLDALLLRISRLSAPIVMVIAIIALPFAGRIGTNSTELLIWGFATWVLILATTTLGFLVGLGRIRMQAVVNLLGALARLAVGWPLMLFGFGVGGALFGYAVNSMVVVVATYVICIRAMHGRNVREQATNVRLKLELSSMTTFVLVFAPFCLDQILVQVFNPALGGAYAAAATIAKLVFFVTFPITTVAYPYLLRQPELRKGLPILGMTSLSIFVIACVLCALLQTYSGYVAQLFFGNQFAEIVPHLGTLAMGTACFSLSSLGAHALIAWKSRFGFLPSLLALATGLALFASRHDSLAVVVANQLMVYSLQLVLVVALLAATIWRSRAA